MSKEIVASVELMPKAQIALLKVAQHLSEQTGFDTRLMGEITNYAAGTAALTNRASEKTAFYKFAAAFFGANLKMKVITTGLRLKLAPNTLGKIYGTCVLGEHEARTQFLLSHGHPAQRIADVLFPNSAEKEASIAESLDTVLGEARRLRLPALASVVEARRNLARQRVATQQPTL